MALSVNLLGQVLNCLNVLWQTIMWKVSICYISYWCFQSAKAQPGAVCCQDSVFLTGWLPAGARIILHELHQVSRAAYIVAYNKSPFLIILIARFDLTTNLHTINAHPLFTHVETRQPRRWRRSWRTGTSWSRPPASWASPSTRSQVTHTRMGYPRSLSGSGVMRMFSYIE